MKYGASSWAMKRLYALIVGAMTAVVPRPCSIRPPMNQRAASERPIGSAVSSNAFAPSASRAETCRW
jgi:hypothetical protein